jgi:hypothetical protein
MVAVPAQDWHVPHSWAKTVPTNESVPDNCIFCCEIVFFGGGGASDRMCLDMALLGTHFRVAPVKAGRVAPLHFLIICRRLARVVINFAAILRRISRSHSSPSSCFVFIVLFEQLERGHERRRSQTQQRIDTVNMPELVGVGKVPAVPRHEHVAIVE